MRIIPFYLSLFFWKERCDLRQSTYEHGNREFSGVFSYLADMFVSFSHPSVCFQIRLLIYCKHKGTQMSMTISIILSLNKKNRKLFTACIFLHKVIIVDLLILRNFSSKKHSFYSIYLHFSLRFVHQNADGTLRYLKILILLLKTVIDLNLKKISEKIFLG